MTLETARVGETLEIKSIASPDTAMMAMRLGIFEGETVQVCSKVPGGPLVIRRGGMEIALGRELCRTIEVEQPEKPQLPRF